MASENGISKDWYIAGLGIVSLLIVIVLELLAASGSLLGLVARGAAMLGYLFVFYASLSSLFLRRLVKFFGRSFVKTHHLLSVTALVLLFIHPLSVALQARDAAVFIPSFASWYLFWAYAGRVAFYLLAIAALVALYRTKLRDSWRYIHWLNYVAFIFATVHGLLIGTDFQFLLVRIVAILMAVGVAVAFVVKRRQLAARKKS
jgi:predicted ferric reductase